MPRLRSRVRAPFSAPQKASRFRLAFFVYDTPTAVLHARQRQVSTKSASGAIKVDTCRPKHRISAKTRGRCPKKLRRMAIFCTPILLRRDRQGCRRTGNKMPVRRHPAALTGSENPRQPFPPTLPTAPDGAGKRPQAPARLPHRLTQKRQRQCFAERVKCS